MALRDDFKKCSHSVVAKQKLTHERVAPIHERVTAVVRGAGLTNAELAKKTGWSYLRVLRLLNGDTDLTAEDMEVIADIVKRPVAELYEAPAS